MTPLLTLSANTGRKLAEVGFLLVIIAGIWLAASQLPQLRRGAFRMTGAGVLLAAGGVLVLVAIHWGHFS